MTFQIRTAERQGARLLIQLSGVSGSGKTFSALQLAFGLAGGDASKIIGIDTENRRMSLNADCLPGGHKFRVLDFFAPFSPARYIEAIDAAVQAGAEVIVIDSVTHEWESEGGCEWIANQALIRGQKLADWKNAKAQHKRFMTHMLQSSAHIIACTRAREKADFTDPKSPRPLGIQPIQEKNFSFEATVSLLMHEQGSRQDVLKCPAELQRILGRGRGYITAEDGYALKAWVDGGTPVNPQLEQARGTLQNAAEGGIRKLETAWAELPNDLRRELAGDWWESVKASAMAYDQNRSGVMQESEAVQALNAQIRQQSLQSSLVEPTPEPVTVQTTNGNGNGRRRQAPEPLPLQQEPGNMADYLEPQD